jgi:hypothetical protein
MRQSVCAAYAHLGSSGDFSRVDQVSRLPELFKATRESNPIRRVNERAPSQLSAKTTEFLFVESYIQLLNNPSAGRPFKVTAAGGPASLGKPRDVRF